MYKSDYIVESILDGLSIKLEAYNLLHDINNLESALIRHCHNYIELYSVMKGSIELDASNQTYCLSQGMYGLIPKGVYHSPKNLSDDFIARTFILDINCAESAGNAAKFVYQSLKLNAIITGNDSDVSQLVHRLSYELLNNKPGKYIAIQCQIQFLMLTLARLVSQEKANLQLQDSDLHIRRSFEIDDFFHHKFYLSDGSTQLSKQLCVSKRHLNRILKQLFGKSYREKLLETRFEVAVDLLLRTNKSIAEIAEILGYSSPSHFGVMILKKTGKTPTELRRDLRTI